MTDNQFGVAYIYAVGSDACPCWRVAVSMLDVEGSHDPAVARQIAADILKAADEAERRNQIARML